MRRMNGKMTGAALARCCAMALVVLAGAGIATPVTAQNIPGALGVPQMNALLPDKYNVPETEALPIDGVWMISTIGKRIRIERGRAYAVDPWLHMFVLKVQPDMVVLRNFQRTGAGQYAADDLPLLGRATFALQTDGNMRANVQGAMGPVAYTLIRREPDDPVALDEEIAALTGQAPPPIFTPPPVTAPPPVATPDPAPAPGGDGSLANCRNLGIDPKTGNIACFD